VVTDGRETDSGIEIYPVYTAYFAIALFAAAGVGMAVVALAPRAGAWAWVAAALVFLPDGLMLFNGFARQGPAVAVLSVFVVPMTEAFGSAPGEGVLDRERAAQLEDVLGGVVTTDAVPARRVPFTREALRFQLDHLRHACSLQSMCS